MLLVNSLLEQPRIWVLFLAVRCTRACCDPAAGLRIVHPKDNSAGIDDGRDGAQFDTLEPRCDHQPALAGIIAVKLGPTVAYALDLVTFVATITLFTWSAT